MPLLEARSRPSATSSKIPGLLFGDDRRIIDSVHRTAAVAHCLQRSEEILGSADSQEKLPPLTGGSVGVLAKAAREVFYHQDARRILKHKAAEGKVGSVRVLNDYADLLDERRLIEIGTAIWELMANAKLMGRNDLCGPVPAVRHPRILPVLLDGLGGGRPVLRHRKRGRRHLHEIRPKPEAGMRRIRGLIMASHMPFIVLN